MSLADSLRYAVAKTAKAASDKLAAIPKSLGLQGSGAFLATGSEVLGVDSSKIETAFSEADAGNPSALFSMSMEMLSANSSISAHWGTRKNSLMGLDWDVVDTASGRKGKSKDADALRKAVDNGTLRTVLQCLSDAPLLGFSGCLVEWDAELKTPVKAFPVHPERWRFDFGGNPAVLLPDADGKPVETPLDGTQPGMAVWAAYSKSMHPARCGLCRPLLWLHLFRSKAMQLRAKYIERYGMPYIKGTLTGKQWGDEDLRKKFMSQLESGLASGVILRSEGMDVDIAGHTGAAANADHGKWIQDLDLDAARLILGQTGTSGDSSGMSNGGAQTEVREALLAADAMAVGEAVATRLLRPCAAFLGMKEPERFEFQFNIQTADDLNKKAVMVKTLSDAGFKADPQWIGETFGFPIVETIDVTPQPVAIPDAPSDQPAQLAMSDAAPQDPAMDIERLVARASAAVASQAFGSVEEMAAMYGPIRKAVSTAFADLDLTREDWIDGGMERLKTLSDLLPEAVREMDFTAFKEALRLAQNGAAVEGYVGS